MFNKDAGVGADNDWLNVVIPYILFVFVPRVELPNVIVPVDVSYNEIAPPVVNPFMVSPLILVYTLKTPFTATLEELVVPIFIVPVCEAPPILILPVVILSNKNTPAVNVTPFIDVKNRKFVSVVSPLIVFVTPRIVFVLKLLPKVIPPLVVLVYKFTALVGAVPCIVLPMSVFVIVVLPFNLIVLELLPKIIPPLVLLVYKFTALDTPTPCIVLALIVLLNIFVPEKALLDERAG